MDEVFIHALEEYEQLFALLVRRVPPPVRVPRGESFVFRYSERTAQQAIILKLARSICGLHAARILLDHGFVQEVGSLQRILDDFQENVMFLGLALTGSGLEPIHEKYLEAFYMDDFENADEPMSALDKKRPHVSRKDIREAIDRSADHHATKSGQDVLPRSGAARVISKLYSGFVHGGAPQILEMYGGLPAHFHLRGMAGTPLIAVCERDLWNQFYRVSQSFTMAALVLEELTVSERIEVLQSELEEQAGVDYSGGTPEQS